MRLGSILDVTTSTSEDKRLNHLHVDWSVFDDLDKMVQDIELVPTVGARKPPTSKHRTYLRRRGGGRHVRCSDARGQLAYQRRSGRPRMRRGEWAARGQLAYQRRSERPTRGAPESSEETRDTALDATAAGTDARASTPTGSAT